jgi:hypothetical protein
VTQLRGDTLCGQVVRYQVKGTLALGISPSVFTIRAVTSARQRISNLFRNRRAIQRFRAFHIASLGNI